MELKKLSINEMNQINGGKHATTYSSGSTNGKFKDVYFVFKKNNTTSSTEENNDRTLIPA